MNLNFNEIEKEVFATVCEAGFSRIKSMEEVIIKAAVETGHIITVEEHSIFNGLGAAVAEVVVQNKPVTVKVIGIQNYPKHGLSLPCRTWNRYMEVKG